MGQHLVSLNPSSSSSSGGGSRKGAKKSGTSDDSNHRRRSGGGGLRSGKLKLLTSSHKSKSLDLPGSEVMIDKCPPPITPGPTLLATNSNEQKHQHLLAHLTSCSSDINIDATLPPPPPPTPNSQLTPSQHPSSPAIDKRTSLNPHSTDTGSCVTISQTNVSSSMGIVYDNIGKKLSASRDILRDNNNCDKIRAEKVINENTSISINWEKNVNSPPLPITQSPILTSSPTRSSTGIVSPDNSGGIIVKSLQENTPPASFQSYISPLVHRSSASATVAASQQPHHHQAKEKENDKDGEVRESLSPPSSSSCVQQHPQQSDASVMPAGVSSDKESGPYNVTSHQIGLSASSNISSSGSCVSEKNDNGDSNNDICSDSGGDGMLTNTKISSLHDGDGDGDGGGGGGNDDNRNIISGLSEEENDERQKSIVRRNYAFNELVGTEKDYVKDLGLVVEGYIDCMRKDDPPVPDDLKNGKDKIVFGNIEHIYEWHRDFFLNELIKCLEESNRLGLLFKRYERRLNMYVVYCQNKSKSEYIVSEYLDTYFEDVRQKLGHKLQLPDLLIKPIQRIMKYQLLLNDILKHTEKAGLTEELDNLRRAVHIMHIVPKIANDMMNVSRLQGFDGKITAQGKLLMQGILMAAETREQPVTPQLVSNIKLKERQVFLFEQILILSEIIGSKGQFSNPMYIYKNHLQVNKMSLQENSPDSDELKFILKSKDPQQEGLAFVVQAYCMEERNEWVRNIQAILETQLDFLRALQSPIAYQKELTKEVSAPELGSLWNPCLRKTFSHPASAHRQRLAKSESKNGSGGGASSSNLKSSTDKPSDSLLSSSSTTTGKYPIMSSKSLKNPKGLTFSKRGVKEKRLSSPVFNAPRFKPSSSSTSSSSKGSSPI
ncbi:uncharacterized protein LOC141858316 [Brevipalpus obovatus]|uniref:uncharacterized protein LOC141858316 n=1 Tax=Brevipalpus obovatus TaxID=246614 RepID=UPI003D9F55F4